MCEKTFEIRDEIVLFLNLLGEILCRQTSLVSYDIRGSRLVFQVVGHEMLETDQKKEMEITRLVQASNDGLG
jgi:hypothetical protein